MGGQSLFYRRAYLCSSRSSMRVRRLSISITLPVNIVKSARKPCISWRISARRVRPSSRISVRKARISSRIPLIWIKTQSEAGENGYNGHADREVELNIRHNPVTSNCSNQRRAKPHRLGFTRTDCPAPTSRSRWPTTLSASSTPAQRLHAIRAQHRRVLRFRPQSTHGSVHLRRLETRQFLARFPR